MNKIIMTGLLSVTILLSSVSAQAAWTEWRVFSVTYIGSMQKCSWIRTNIKNGRPITSEYKYNYGTPTCPYP